MADGIPSVAAEVLNPEYRSILLREYTSGNSSYYVILQYDDESGGEVLVEVTGNVARVVAIDTTVLPLADRGLPPDVMDALSSLSLQGTIGPETSERNLALAGPLTQQRLNELVYQAAQHADGTLSTDVPGTEHGNLACAWAINEVVRRALGKPIGGGLSTIAVSDILRRSHQPVSAAQITPGTIIVSPTQGSVHGHIGIVGAVPAGGAPGSREIYSNRSSAAMFGHTYTIDSWNAHYSGHLGLQVLFFNLNPAVFGAAITSASVMTARTLPGLNKIIDLYAGDAPHPDFVQIRNSGVVAFIFKATDPLYTFNSDLYMRRRRDAKAAGLLWGSYHFGRAGDGAAQAQMYLNAIQPTDDEIVCFDFELPHTRPDTVMSLSQAARFVQTVQTTLHKPPFLYGGNYLREQLHGAASSPLTVCPLWFADYRHNPQPEIPALFHRWTIWQWAGDVLPGQPYSVPTIDKVDRDTFQGTEAELRQIWRCRP
jgi:GH25 family lysozyme M1 (1,4-beta-N-acetylmuramidase)